MLIYQTDLKVKPEELLQTAQELVRTNRARGWAALNDLFRAGSPPDPQPEGRLAGELVALNIAPGLTQFYSWLTQAWMPWRGKTFDSTQKRGENIFTPRDLGRPVTLALKIDYDLPENPSLTVRRVLDELIQLDEGLYLGKAHVRWWWSSRNSWQTVAFFSLRKGFHSG